LVEAHFIGWIAVYPVDKVIRPLNNWGQIVSLAVNITLSKLVTELWNRGGLGLEIALRIYFIIKILGYFSCLVNFGSPGTGRCQKFFSKKIQHTNSSLCLQLPLL